MDLSRALFLCARVFMVDWPIAIMVRIEREKLTVWD